MDRYEKWVLRVAFLVIGVFVFLIVYTKATGTSDLPQCVPYDTSYMRPRFTKLDDSTYQVFYVARMWNFEPAEVTVPVGSTVDLYLTSADVVHGFDIDSRNINMMAEYGGVGKQTVRFTEPGDYLITCHEYCGVGHQNMQSRIHVVFPQPNKP